MFLLSPRFQEVLKSQASNSPSTQEVPRESQEVPRESPQKFQESLPRGSKRVSQEVLRESQKITIIFAAKSSKS
jgi:hypothetical protein